MSYKNLLVEIKGPVAVIQVNRPHAMNALNREVLEDFKNLLNDFEDNPEIRAAVITGNGEKAFVAGADIKEMENLNSSQARDMARNGQGVFQRIEDLPFPVIAAVNGFALGGGLELALACDFILASNKTKWGLPEVSLGLIPGYGGTQRLVRQVGRGIAKRVALSGEMFSAQQGADWGVFTQLFEPADLMPAALKLAETLASRAPRAVGWVKAAIHQGHDQPQADGLSLEADLFARTFETKDRVEGIKAFIEKRPPVFQGE